MGTGMMKLSCCVWQRVSPPLRSPGERSVRVGQSLGVPGQLPPVPSAPSSPSSHGSSSFLERLQGDVLIFSVKIQK